MAFHGGQHPSGILYVLLLIFDAWVMYWVHCVIFHPCTGASMFLSVYTTYKSGFIMPISEIREKHQKGYKRYLTYSISCCSICSFRIVKVFLHPTNLHISIFLFNPFVWAFICGVMCKNYKHFFFHCGVRIINALCCILLTTGRESCWRLKN